MEPVNRRTFIKGAATAVAVGGVAATVPLSAASASTRAQHDLEAILDHEHSTLDETVIAHLKNLRTGEFALYVGEREITVHDRSVAARLFAASKERK